MNYNFILPSVSHHFAALSPMPAALLLIPMVPEFKNYSHQAVMENKQLSV